VSKPTPSAWQALDGTVTHMRRSTHHLVTRAHQLGRPTPAWRAAWAADAAESGLPMATRHSPLADQGLFGAPTA
jgi:hypothetical protein